MGKIIITENEKNRIISLYKKDFLILENTTNRVWHKNLEYKKPDMLYKNKPFTGTEVKYFDETKETENKDFPGLTSSYKLSDEEVKNNPVYSETQYKNGKKDGVSKGYTKNGDVAYKGDYKNGNPIGVHNYYLEDGSGELHAYQDYDKGGKLVKVNLKK